MAIEGFEPLNTLDSQRTADRAALLHRLVDEHFDYLYRYSARFFRNSDIADDIVQETYLAATKAVERFEGRSNHRIWLLGILRHKIHDRLRLKKRDFVSLSTQDDDRAEEALFDHENHWRPETGPLLWGEEPDRAVERRQFFAALDRCLQKLPERLRQIFLLREVEGLEREEISERCGATPNNIGVMLYRSRLSLQQCLQENWFLSPEGRSS